MEADGAENGPKLRRGRISLERKREILEQYDQLDKSWLDADAAAKLGVRPATLSKILSERDELENSVGVLKETTGLLGADESDGPRSSPKLKSGGLSSEKQKELLAQYDELPNCSYGEAARKLGIKEATLLKLLASRKSINSGKRKRKQVDVDSSSGSDNYETASRVPSASGVRRGRISAKRQNDLLKQYDMLPKPVSNQVAAAKLGISQAALAKLLSIQAGRQSPQPGSSGIRSSPQPRSSGLNMTLRKGRRVRVDYSEDEQSGSDYKENYSDFTDDGEDGAEKEWNAKASRKKKQYTPEEKERLLAKYDELMPIPQWRAAQILGITQSTLSNWLQHRNLAATKPKMTNSKKGDDSLSGEEIDCYVLGSTSGTQVVQFFEVKDPADNSNAIVRKPYMTLREKYELYKKYDLMDADSQRDAAARFNVNKGTWLNLIANRFHYEQRFKNRLRKDMEVLNKYDELENKGRTSASRVLNVQVPALNKLLASRATIEQYYKEVFGEDGESIAQSVDEMESTWKDSESLASLETKLLQWSKQAKNEKVVDLKVLKAKAKALAAESGMDGFHPSDGWLRKWNKTHKVFKDQKGKLKTVSGFGGNQTVSECVLMALKEYPPENVFNLVETGLFYRAIPGHPPVTNDWVSVAFISNMSGTEKKRLLAVGRSEAPLCFRVMPLPLVYKQSGSGSMTKELVCDLLQEWDRELAEAKRDIAVILESSSSHPNVELNRISLFFVPTELSEEQPLRDVVGHAKALYRQRMAQSTQNLSLINPGKISIVDALFALAEAWEKVPKSLLVSKFLNSAFPQNDGTEPNKDNLNDGEELERLNKLDDEIQLHSTSDELPSCKFEDTEISELDGGHVVHMEGTLKLSDEEEDDFDIDSLLRDEVALDCPSTSDIGHTSTPDLGSKLKIFLQKPSAPNGSLAADQNRSPTASEVRGALVTIKRFLQLNGCTLEDLTDYTQLEIKVLAKIKNMSADSQLR